VTKNEDGETSNVEGTERTENKENAEVKRSNQLYCFPWVDGKKYDILRSALQNFGIQQKSVLGPSVRPSGSCILTNHNLLTAEMSNETYRNLPILLNLEGSKTNFEIGPANGWVVGKKFQKVAMLTTMYSTIPNRFHETAQKRQIIKQVDDGREDREEVGILVRLKGCYSPTRGNGHHSWVLYSQNMPNRKAFPPNTLRDKTIRIKRETNDRGTTTLKFAEKNVKVRGAVRDKAAAHISPPLHHTATPLCKALMEMGVDCVEATAATDRIKGRQQGRTPPPTAVIVVCPSADQQQQKQQQQQRQQQQRQQQQRPGSSSRSRAWPRQQQQKR